MNFIQTVRRMLKLLIFRKNNSRLDFKTEMFDVFFRNHDERSECYERLKREFDEIEITTSMTNNLEIMPKGINKGSALR